MRVRRWLAPAVGVMVALSAILIGAPPVRAVTSADWNPGLIISDSVFYDSTAMTATQIQTLLNTQGASCQDGAVPCLRNYKTDTPTMPADSYCKQTYVGASGETAATIIAKVGVACGINPQVLIATMQKETSLVTSTAPSQSLYNKAMGYGCPDSSICDPTFAAFFNQVYRAAWQFQVYQAKPAGTYSFYPGGTFSIPYSPSAPCGSSSVTIQDWATASLYIYTPYQPNAAALANLYATGDSCSSYGNRNFWTIFNDWFGPTTQAVSIAGVSITGTPQVGTVLTAQAQGVAPSSASVAYQWLRGGVAISGATGATYTPVAADAGASISVKATSSASGYLSASATSAAVAVTAGTLTGATPTISGTVEVGQTLTADPGAWSPSATTLSYQWLRNGVAISGATGSTYTLVDADADQPISVTVTGTLSGYANLSETSATVSTIVSIPVYRLLNPTTGQHLFTSDTNEYNTLLKGGQWVKESVVVAWNAPNSGTPVYRLFNKITGEHLYTTDTNEVRVNLAANTGWVSDNNGDAVFYSEADSALQVPVYRAFNPFTAGSHLYTTSQFEFNNAINNLGWRPDNGGKPIFYGVTTA